MNVLALFTSGYDVRDEPAAAPFFTVELTSSRQPDIRWSFRYVPSADALQIVRAEFSGIPGTKPTSNVWVRPAASVLAAYDTAAAGLRPFPANGGWVAERPADGPARWPLVVALAAAAAAGLLLIGRYRRPLHRRVSGPVGTIGDEDHAWDDDPAAWVRAQRRADGRRAG